MTSNELLAAVNAAGITPDELTVTLKGGALSVRNTTLGLKVEALEKSKQEAIADIDAQIGALKDEIDALRVAQVAAVGS